MNLIMITTLSRPDIFEQSVDSLRRNSTDWKKHHLTIVYNGDGTSRRMELSDYISDELSHSVVVLGNVGASRARNVGASSVPKYLRHENVCFFDDDIYACRGWDERIEYIVERREAIISSHAHPYNHTVLADTPAWIETNVISTVHMTIPWAVWDEVGFFQEPGGAGGSEDVDYCNRATKLRCPLLITKPHYVLHTGVTSSNGTPIVGSELVMERNRELERVHNIVGKVRYA